MEDRSGYVYLLKAHKPFEECYKIGRTKDPEKRLKDFGVKLPYKVDVLYLIHTADMYEAESVLHQTFAKKRVEGEWFHLDGADLQWFRAMNLLDQAASLANNLILKNAETNALRWEKSSDREYVERRLLATVRAVRRVGRRYELMRCALRAVRAEEPKASGEA